MFQPSWCPNAFLGVAIMPYKLRKPHIAKGESPLTSDIQLEAKLERNVQKLALTTKAEGIKNIIILLKVII